MLAAPIHATIASYGCVSPLGLHRSETVASLRDARDGISPVRLFSTEGCQAGTAGQVDSFLSEYAVRRAPASRYWTRAAQMILCAMAEALDGRPGFSPDVVIIGTTSGGMLLGEEFLRAALSGHGIGAASRRIRGYVPSQPVRQAMRALRIDAPVRIVSNACASGSNALGLGLHLIRHGQARRVLAGGYDALASLVFSGFDCLRASTSEKCRPFDASRSGLALGEGAAMFCLESAHAFPLRLAGYGSAFDAHHLTQPHPSGRGPREAMLRALSDAGVDAEEIDYINAHGTGTPLNDSSEALAIQETCPRSAVSSTKSMTGHALGAAGAIEAAFCCMALEEGFLPANINFRQPDPGISLDIVANHIRFTQPRKVLSNSFGFGGSNASLVLARS